ncbi:MFS transporter [Nocardioides aquiterrae]|uniref:MFS transporter n=1 Tax=Nocardioides aquiterrae TaxID=203799 RepID=A0ABN1UCV9_9ACTN
MAALLLVAAALRPSITSVGPVIDQVGDALALSNTLLGLLAALPLLAFSAMSVLVAWPTRRYGIDRVVAASLLLMTVALMIRVLPAPGGIWVGTVLVAVAVAVGNVLVPAVVKRDHSGSLAATTGLYTVALTASAALASGVSYPLSQLPGASWRLSLGVWVLFPVVAALAWRARSKNLSGSTSLPNPGVVAPQPAGGPIWSSTLAWAVTAFMGLQSLNFYVLVTWLPTIEVATGTAPSVAGWHLFLMQMLGMMAGFATSRALARTTDQRLFGVLVTAPILVALPGLALVPSMALLWVLATGVSTGASFVLALSMLGLRSSSTSATVQLSGMAQSVGYLLAAAGPVVSGWLHDRTGDWRSALLLMTGLAVAQCGAVLVAGRAGHWDAIRDEDGVDCVR